jgi:hypothetical protein
MWSFCDASDSARLFFRDSVLASIALTLHFRAQIELQSVSEIWLLHLKNFTAPLFGTPDSVSRLSRPKPNGSLFATWSPKTGRRWRAFVCVTPLQVWNKEGALESVIFVARVSLSAANEYTPTCTPDPDGFRYK